MLVDQRVLDQMFYGTAYSYWEGIINFLSHKC